jgi:hypothetical protein
MSEQEEFIRQLREENALLKQANKMQEERMFEMKKEHSSSMNKMEERINELQKRINLWQSFFTREFVAVIVGAILLIIFAAFLMISMYNNIPTTEVITNGFFVLLGFFFSQTAKGMTSKEGRNPESIVH